MRKTSEYLFQRKRGKAELHVCRELAKMIASQRSKLFFLLVFLSSSLRLLFYCHCCRCQIITSNIIIISLLRSCCGRSHASSLSRLRESGPPLSWSSPSSSFISNRINDQRPLLACSLSWYSAAAVSLKSRVRTPHMPELFQAFFAMIFFTIHSLSLNSNI